MFCIINEMTDHVNEHGNDAEHNGKKSLDEHFKSIIEGLKETRENYPQLTDLWAKYIKIKKENFEEMLKKAEYFITHSNDLLDGDISPKMVSILYLFFNNHLNVV